LAGCWQSSGSLFGDAKTVQPFRPGKLVSSNPDKPSEVSHSLLSREKGGTYRLTNVDKGSDFGDAMVLRFVALPDLPKDVFVFEAVADDKCRPGNTCHPLTAKSERNYGLVRVTSSGAEVENPDCDKSSAVARTPGVKADDYGTCSFSSRASLEAALQALAGQSWKTSMTYRYE
jgi:hypothetical protein